MRDDHEDYAETVAAACAAAGLRSEVDPSGGSSRPAIRRAKLDKIPYVLVVGDDDVGGGTVGVNRRGWPGRPERGVAVDDLVAEVVDEVARKGQARGPGARVRGGAAGGDGVTPR